MHVEVSSTEWWVNTVTVDFEHQCNWQATITLLYVKIVKKDASLLIINIKDYFRQLWIKKEIKICQCISCSFSMEQLYFRCHWVHESLWLLNLNAWRLQILFLYTFISLLWCVFVICIYSSPCHFRPETNLFFVLSYFLLFAFLKKSLLPFKVLLNLGVQCFAEGTPYLPPFPKYLVLLFFLQWVQRYTPRVASSELTFIGNICLTRK